MRPMRRTTVGASTGVLLLLGTLLAAGGGDHAQGYVAMGPADTTRAPAKPVAPTDKVTLTPLDGEDDGSDDGQGGGHGGTASDGSDAGGTNAPPPGGHSPGASQDPTPGTPEGGPSSGTGDKTDPPHDGTPGNDSGSGSDDPAPSDPDTHSPSSPPADDTPALLEVAAPLLADADKRWCEKVTVHLRNTGGSPVRSGTLTFKTHIIGGLGIDWDTRESTRDLPAPIPAGESRKHTWKICVAAWRVPLGMHIDTKDVDADWK